MLTIYYREFLAYIGGSYKSSVWIKMDLEKLRSNFWYRSIFRINRNTKLPLEEILFSTIFFMIFCTQLFVRREIWIAISFNLQILTGISLFDILRALMILSRSVLQEILLYTWHNNWIWGISMTVHCYEHLKVLLFS